MPDTMETDRLATQRAIAEIKALHESDERWARYIAETQRAQAQELPDDVLFAEMERRGYAWVFVTQAARDAQRREGWVCIRFDRLPPIVSLPFDAERDGR